MYGRGSLYVYVVVAPPSYEHAHTSIAVSQLHSVFPFCQHTLPAIGASPTDGCAGWSVARRGATVAPVARAALMADPSLDPDLLAPPPPR